MIAELDNSGTPAVVRNFLWGLGPERFDSGGWWSGWAPADAGFRLHAISPVQNAMGNIRGPAEHKREFLWRAMTTRTFGDLLTSSGSLAGDNPFPFLLEVY